MSKVQNVKHVEHLKLNLFFEYDGKKSDQEFLKLPTELSNIKKLSLQYTRSEEEEFLNHLCSETSYKLDIKKNDFNP